MLGGRDLLERIPATLDNETDEARAKAAREFADTFRSYVNNAITAEESLEAFAVYRRFDLAQTRGGQSSSIESMKDSAAKLCDDLAVHFESIPKATLASFVSEHWQDYASKRGALFAARSRGTHVGGVLRPLSKRYFKQWESELSKRSDFVAIQQRIQKLLNAPITDVKSFEKWAEAVLWLFSDIGVYRPARGATEQGAKPNGMISEGSLRTYKQQWTSWTANNVGKLLIPESGLEISEKAVAEEAHETSPQLDHLPDRTQGIRVTLHNREDPSFRLEKHWPSIENALGEIGNWVEIAEKVWGKTSVLVVDLDCFVEKLDLELRFEANNISYVANKVVAVLSAAR